MRGAWFRRKEVESTIAVGLCCTHNAYGPVCCLPERKQEGQHPLTGQRAANFAHDQLFQPKRWKLPSFLLTNLRSLTNKLDDFETVVRLNNPDVVCATETWLSSDVPTESVSMNGFSLFRKDRNRQGGGIACYVRSSIPCSVLTECDETGLESLWLILRPARMPRWLTHVVVGIIYHPPDANNRRMIDHITNTIDHISRANPNCGIAAVGDFNRLPDGQLRNYPLRQVVRGSTRKSALLDKIYTNMSQWYNLPAIIPQIGSSDHRAVVMHPTGRGVRCKSTYKVDVVRSQDPNGKALMVLALRTFNWSSFYRLTSCDEMIAVFYNVIHTLLNQYLPLRARTRNLNDKPWVTEEFCRIIRRRQYAWTHRHMDDYRRYRNQATRLAKSLRQRYYNVKVKHLRQINSRNWWRRMKQFTGQSKQSDLSGLANSVASGDLSVLADMINESLKHVSDDLEPVSEDSTAVSHQVPDDYIISPETVFAKLNRINVHKAPGPDDVPNWVFRDFAPLLYEPLCAVFNASVREGKVPSLWKHANVLPIPKVNPPKSIDSDLRPISLTPTVSKVLEAIVGSWILDIVGCQLDDHQFGALKGRSTTHALVDMVHHWHKALDEGHSVRVLFVDYAKAFDHVDHVILLQKLKSYGVPSFILRWMTSFLCERQQRVKVMDTVSDWVTLRGGMPQGSWLGPLIFIILIDDLRPRLLTHKFVDDTTLSEIVAKGSESKMLGAVDYLIKWSQLNRLNINSKKTKELILGSVDKDSVAPLTVSSTVVERVSQFKILGIMVNSDLKWDDHVAAITSKAGKRLWFMKQLRRAGVCQNDLLYYYQSVVRPVLEYASPCWHSSLTKEQNKQLEDVQRRALHIICGNISYDEARRLCNIPPLHERRHELGRTFFQRIVRDKSNVLWYLLPAKRDAELSTRLRYAKQFPRIFARTNRFKNSFIVFGLNNLQ